MNTANYAFKEDTDYPDCAWLDKKSDCILCNDGFYMTKVYNYNVFNPYDFFCNKCTPFII